VAILGLWVLGKGPSATGLPDTAWLGGLAASLLGFPGSEFVAKAWKQGGWLPFLLVGLSLGVFAVGSALAQAQRRFYSGRWFSCRRELREKLENPVSEPVYADTATPA
jgi:hypothetical protein